MTGDDIRALRARRARRPSAHGRDRARRRAGRAVLARAGAARTSSRLRSASGPRWIGRTRSSGTATPPTTISGGGCTSTSASPSWSSSATRSRTRWDRCTGCARWESCDGDRDGRRDRRWLDAYGRMLLIRHFENEMQRLFLKGEVHGTTHLAAGQEAVPVGVCLALEPGDYVAGTYRGHGHALAKGTDPAALAAEMLGRAGGVCGGPGRLDERDRPVARAGRLLRDRRRLDRRGHRRRPERQAPGPRGGRLLRRRRHQPGVLPRVPELRRRALAAGRVRLREQLLRRVHADAEGHRRARHRGPRRRLRDRARRWSTATTCGRSRAPRARPSPAPAASTRRRCSSARPTATTATRSPTRRPTGRRRRSSAGSSATR